MSQKELEMHMRQIIDKLSSGTEFFVRDIIADPPALLGRHLFKDIQNGTITNVCFIGKVDGIDRYRKL